jgi:hypothetical protein
MTAVYVEPVRTDFWQLARKSDGAYVDPLTHSILSEFGADYLVSKCPTGDHEMTSCPEPGSRRHDPYAPHPASPLLRPDVSWKWGKWTFGFWVDRENKTRLGIDVGPLEVVWRAEGYRP